MRRELEKYMKEHFKLEVLEELERLKKQNRELQDKVFKLEKTHKDPSPIKGCLKRSATGTKKAKIFNDDNNGSPRRVRFATKLDNDTSLDSDTRERIEHNLKYNDDTIFDNISIFRDVNNSGQATNKIIDKEVHPSLLKNKINIHDEDEEMMEEAKVPKLINSL